MPGRFRDVDGRGQRYPRWVNQLRGKCGAYAIRWRASGRVLYVGESHSGRLRQTMVRHLSTWRRPRWLGDYSPPVSYQRGRVQVAAWVTRTPDEAIAMQVELIGALRPRDNVYLWNLATEEDVPF